MWHNRWNQFTWYWWSLFMVPYQKEKAHEDEDGHCGHGHRVWDQAGDVVVQWVQGFQDHLFKEVLLCFREGEREREREGAERQRLSKLRCVQSAWYLSPLCSSYKWADQLWMWLYNKSDCLECLPGQASSQVKRDMKQTRFLLGNNKGFLTLMLRHSFGYFGWQTFYCWYQLGWGLLLANL